MDFAVCLFFCSLISWRELEAFSFKLFYFYQDIEKGRDYKLKHRDKF